MKRCPRCGIEKSLDDFARDAAKKDGRQGYCRRCKAELAPADSAKRRDKIRAWERAHTTPCEDCGEPVSDGYRKTSRKAQRCASCSRTHRREIAIAETRRMLAMRAEGFLNHEIAERMDTTPPSVANRLSRGRLRTLGLLNERVQSPYYAKATS